MATFGNTLVAYALDPTTGLPLPGVELYAWTDESGGTPLLSVLSGLDGSFGWEYDTTADGQWVSAGLTGPRVYVPNNDALAARATTVYVDERLATKANAATVGAISARVDTTETRVGTVEDELTGRLSEPALAAAYVPRTATIDDLPATGILAVHRGSGGLYPIGPESAMGTYRLAAAMGAHILDVDAFRTKDGVFVAMHDNTVDRTTAATGLVSTFSAADLPPVYLPETVGSGWGPEPVPTIEDLLQEFGGRVLLNIEVKEGLPAVVPMCNLIKKYGLEKSVFVNHYAYDVLAAIVAEGCLAYGYGLTLPGNVTPYKNTGASIVELPYNASQALMDATLAAGFYRVMAAPVKSRTEQAAMTPGFHGLVTDAPGYVGRTTGPLSASNTIGGAIASARRGPGWKITSGYGTGDWLTTAGLKIRDGGQFQQVMLGSVSGTPPTAGSVTMKFRIDTLPTQVGDSVRARVLCPEEGTTGQDGDTKGYVISLRANGQLNLWESPAGAYGGGTALGTAPTGTALVAGTEYAIKFEWTATQVKLTRVDSGATTGWVNSTAWRGDYHYLFSTFADGKYRVTDYTIAGA